MSDEGQLDPAGLLTPEAAAPAADPAAAPVSAAPDAAGTASHDDDLPIALRELMSTGWAVGGELDVAAAAVTPYTAKRRAAVSARFAGEVLVVPTGGSKVRANDTDYPFRAASDFAWLTGELGPDAVLVMTPGAGGHDAVLFVPPRSDRATPAFYRDRRYGELWVGPRRGVRETARRLGVETRPLGDLPALLSAVEAGHAGYRALRGIDADVDRALPAQEEADQEFATALSELRLIKDDHEIAALEDACAATARGFDDVVRELPRAVETSERWLEGTFGRRARVEGNDVGYGSICAAGPHATTLHWTRNDGPVRPGELLLMDMGVEGPELYTADVTRTLPISGSFTAAQRRVYDVVLAAQRAGIAAVRPGADFLDPHRAAMRVIAAALADWGLLLATVEQALVEDDLAAVGAGVHRRWTLHGTSHMLGLDVHDCAKARSERYRRGQLEAGMVLTVEPGLYFQPDDLLAPAELRGIGARIEDDVLVTPDGARVLSSGLPTDPVEVEAWLARRCD